MPPTKQREISRKEFTLNILIELLYYTRIICLFAYHYVFKKPKGKISYLLEKTIMVRPCFILMILSICLVIGMRSVCINLATLGIGFPFPRRLPRKTLSNDPQQTRLSSVLRYSRDDIPKPFSPNTDL